MGEDYDDDNNNNGAMLRKTMTMATAQRATGYNDDGVFKDGCNNQIDDLKTRIYPVRKLLVYCLQLDSGLTVSIILF